MEHGSLWQIDADPWRINTRIISNQLDSLVDEEGATVCPGHVSTERKTITLPVM